MTIITLALCALGLAATAHGFSLAPTVKVPVAVEARHGVLKRPRGHSRIFSLSTTRDEIPASAEWKGEVVSNTPDGVIQGCVIEPKEGSLTEWTITIDGIEADLGRFSEAVYKKVVSDAKRERFRDDPAVSRADVPDLRHGRVRERDGSGGDAAEPIAPLRQRAVRNENRERFNTPSCPQRLFQEAVKGFVRVGRSSNRSWLLADLCNRQGRDRRRLEAGPELQLPRRQREGSEGEGRYRREGCGAAWLNFLKRRCGLMATTHQLCESKFQGSWECCTKTGFHSP
jgi:hypothetical protein